MCASLLLAQIIGTGILGWIITIIIIAAAIAILVVALKHFGVTIPPFVVTIFWILVVAAVAIIGIRFLMSL